MGPAALRGGRETGRGKQGPLSFLPRVSSAVRKGGTTRNRVVGLPDQNRVVS
jgi:hypothetical protein